MKRLLSGFIILFSYANIQAQEIKRIDPSFDDFLPILKSVGYEMFSFDISSLGNSTYNIAFITREYADGVLVHDSSQDDFQYIVTNRDMLSILPEEQQKEVLEKNLAYDAENGIWKLANKITIGFVPAADSLKKYSVNIENMGSLGSTLKLKPLNAPGFNNQYMYDIRPFKVDTIEIGGFTPLVLIGSFWYDSKFDIVRFCGEMEFSKDLSSDTLKLVPHYYVIGIKVEK